MKLNQFMLVDLNYFSQYGVYTIQEIKNQIENIKQELKNIAKN